MCEGLGHTLDFGEFRGYLSAVRAQVDVGVLESGDGTVAQAPCDRHQCVEILQLVKPLEQQRRTVPQDSSGERGGAGGLLS